MEETGSSEFLGVPRSSSESLGGYNRVMALRLSLVALFVATVAFGQAGPGAVPSPAGVDAAQPFLSTTADGRVLLSWLEPVGEKQVALKFATFDGGRWSAPRTIASRADLFVNWADFPSVVADAKGTLFAHWLQKSSAGTYSYDVHVTSSSDGGKSWRADRLLNTDGKQAEHGFVSIVPLPKGGVGALWLDGRAMAGGEHGGHGGHAGHGGGEMMLRYANLDAGLNVSGESQLDTRVCECCATSMTMTAVGPVAVYRDRSAEEIRDIGVVRRTGAKWTAPALVHRDGWKIKGCPVNGPQLDARGNGVAVAWFTAAASPRVNVAFSRDAGATFGTPVRIDSGNPAGRVDVLMLANGSALVTWIESA
ncbi:MAG: hypothetical protein QOH21_3080 [Acidobacteriota bacterium]|nr:hypothetical protein [Acidobacteriota bacterium]